jgi:hypothetical protein
VELRTTWNVVSEFELICGIEDWESTEFELILWNRRFGMD